MKKDFKTWEECINLREVKVYIYVIIMTSIDMVSTLNVAFNCSL